MVASRRAELTSVRLTRFKSFAGAELPLGDLTVLTDSLLLCPGWARVSGLAEGWPGDGGARLAA
jgi:hypothetical protein